MRPSSLRRSLIALIALLCLLLAACSQPDISPADDDGSSEAAAAGDGNLTDGCVEQAEEGADYFPDKVEFAHATSVDVTYHDTYKLVTVRPAANEGEVTPVRFVLVQCGTDAPALEGELAGAHAIEVPARKVASLTTTNLPHFTQLDAVERIAGVGTPGFVSTEEVREHIEAADVQGYADANGQPELEKLVGLAPDVLIMDAFGAEITSELKRFTDAGVPTVLNADFNEQSLLGRAEWVKFTALLLNAEAAANEAFDEVRQAYEDVRAKVPADAERPGVFVNTPYEGNWFVPGGGAYLANAIREAGGEYVLADDDSTFSLQLDVESVLAKAGDADVWLQAGSVKGTLADLAAQDERFSQFKAFRDGQVWAYDKWTTEGGGNAVFEVAYARPDLFLSDLVRILHPDALADHEPVFFGQVPKA